MKTKGERPNEINKEDNPIILWDLSRCHQSSGQCDCACSNIQEDYPLPNLPSITDFDIDLVRTKEVQLFPIPNDSIAEWYIAFRPGSQYVPVILNSRAKALFEKFHSPINGLSVIKQSHFSEEATTEDAINQLINCELITPVNQTPSPIQTHATILTAWIQVTDSCNLNCSYCYIKKSNKTISLGLGLKSVDKLLSLAKIHGYRKIKIKYAGGEPAIFLPLIIQMHNYAIKQARNASIDLEEIILSNGILLNEEKIKQIKESNIKLMISLDGIGKDHDAQRISSDGGETYNLVVRNIDLAINNNLLPDISVTVTNRNLFGLYTLIPFLIERHLPFSLNFYRENPSSSKFDDLRLDESIVTNTLYSLFSSIEENLPPQSPIGSLLDRIYFGNPHYHPCAVGLDYLVINTEGQISKCQMDMGNSITSILDDDPLSKLRLDKSGIQNVSVDEKEGCKECVWRYWCGGGCPLSSYRSKGRYEVKSDYCGIYKDLLPILLIIEGRRIIKRFTHSAHPNEQKN